MRLVQETGHIGKMPYELFLKTLSHIEVAADGSMEVMFFGWVPCSTQNPRIEVFQSPSQNSFFY